MVNDIHFKNGDLVLGTYGRGILIMDDIAFLEELNEAILTSDAHLFPVRDAELFYRNNRDLSNKAARFAGPNPEYGALITYYLREGPVQETGSEADAASDSEGPTRPPEVSIEVLDETGIVVRELTGPDRRGFNRVAWDLRTPADSTGTPAGEEDDRRPRLEEVDPGRYTIRLTARGQALIQTVRVIPDRRR